MRFKLSRNDRKRALGMLYSFAEMVGFWLIVISIAIFFIGFHNIDLSRSILMVSYLERMDYYGYRDTTLQGNILTYDEGHRLGSTQIIIGLFLSINGSFLFVSGKMKVLEKFRKCT